MNTKRLLITFMLVFSLLSTIPLPVMAGTKTSVTTVVKTKSVNLSGYKKYKKAKASTYMKGTLKWVSGTKARFEGTTGGTYSGSNKADKIVQTDTVSAAGVGSISVSGAPTAEISGSSAKFNYSAKKTKKITNSVSYTASKGATISVTVTTSTKYTWGNANVRTEPGNAG